jgi:hypothetical protein
VRGIAIDVIPEALTIARDPDAWAAVRGAFSIESAESALDREQAVTIARPFAAMAPEQLADIPGLLLGLQSKTGGERMRALDAFKELDNERHRQAEYIAYLEAEHHRLSGAVHAQNRAVGRSPVLRARRVAGKLKRRLLR